MIESVGQSSLFEFWGKFEVSFDHLKDVLPPQYPATPDFVHAYP